jgi:hypothetical protein
MPRRLPALVVLSVLAMACDPSRPLSPATAGVRKNITVPVPYVAKVTLTDLGGVDGGTSYGSDVNDSGTVAGWATIPGHITGTTHIPPSNAPFVWSPATGMRFITICCGSAYASGINDSGVVVGTGAHGTAWMYRPGQGVTPLAPLYPAEGTANVVSASRIGKDGRINGDGYGNNRFYDQNAIIWNDWNPSVAIPQLPSYYVTGLVDPYPIGTGIDDNGDATGWFDENHNPCWIFDASGGLTWANVMIGGTPADTSNCNGVNTSRHVVGVANSVVISQAAFLLNFPTGQTTLLGSLTGPNNWSTANDINEDDYVVGQSDYVLPGTTKHSSAAFIWNAITGMVNLGLLKSPNPSCSANAINHDMQGNTIYVAGQCVDASGVTHAVRWTVTIAYRLLS